PPTVFSYPIRGCVGDLSIKLKGELETHPLVSVIHERPTKISLTPEGAVAIDFANRDGLVADRAAWGNSLADLRGALGGEDKGTPYDKCSISLLLLKIPTDALRMTFTVLSVVDPELSIYRVTNQSSCAGWEDAMANVVVELNPDYADAATQAERIDR